ncbi:MAG: DUF2157 domain-containing protein [Actinomycetota bacterium]|nr:DUF2157 domain-containing protein [Actinomycetota bacterium]
MNDLDRMLERWTGAGLLTSEQARAIRAAENRSGRASPAIPALAEVIAYVGAILILSAGAFIASRIWSDLAVGAQLGILALTTGVLWAGGWWMRNDHNPVRHRLVTVLWFLSAGGMGWLADVAASELWDLENGYALIIGLTLSLYAGLLYLYRRTSLQQIAVAGGVVFLCGGLSDIAGGDDWFGLLLWAAGAGWIALTRAGVLTPRRTGFALSAAGVLAGSEAVVIVNFFESPDRWGLALGLISSAALLYLSVSFAAMVLLGFGIAGLFLFLLQIIEEYLGDGLGGPLALLIAGIALLLIAILTVRLKERVKMSEVA